MAVQESHATVLFSGGTDSTLAAARMLEQVERVTLLTCDPGYLFFLGNCGVHAAALQRTYGPERVRHVVLPMRDVARRFLWDPFRRDLARHGADMAALVCLGCRLAMHAAALAWNLEHGVPFIADGSVAIQDAIPEQMESVLAANHEFYFRTFGVWQTHPVWDETASDRALERLGIARQRGLKRQFILFDTQYTCPFGVPADVYARLVYKPLLARRREAASAEYGGTRRAWMEEIVRARLAERGLDLGAIVPELHAFHRRAGRQAS